MACSSNTTTLSGNVCAGCGPPAAPGCHACGRGERSPRRRSINAQTCCCADEGHPTVAPGALLQAPAPTPESSAVVALSLGDAVTHDGNDYLVEGLATSFSDGQTWTLAHLVPSGPGPGEHWLSIATGLELGWLEAIPAPEPDAKQVSYQDTHLDLVATRSSIVQVVSAAGSVPGVLVRAWSYGSGSLLALVEQWPDGTLRAYAGHSVQLRRSRSGPPPDPERARPGRRAGPRPPSGGPFGRATGPPVRRW